MTQTESSNTASGPVDPMDQFERYDTVNTSGIVLVGFISAILTFAIIIAVQAMFYSAKQAELVKKDVNVADATVIEAITQQRQKLTGYSWADDKKKKVSIPIEQAMAMVIENEAAKSEGSDAE
ncbi:MAG: hypothetical protein ABJZ55_25420 [Fuerstiella sp.]